ncbi:MAG: glycosyltransferase [Arcobacteraceae bacterium]|jgi:hypothetical protein|nr:glycosyltransferase [Arcobacteraceae bacterium]
MIKKNLASIVLFTYNRLWHTQQMLEALQKNELAEDSELFIFSDGGKDEESWGKVNEVRQYLKTISGFKNITIIEQEKNLGLADSIISGVTDIIAKYGKVIVLEDDIVTSPYFLNFMNDALNIYEEEKKVWHISGWNYPISNENLNDTFLWRTMNCWGWATWEDRWNNYEKNPAKLIETFTQQEISTFNLDGAINFWEQVIKNNNAQMNTWAIFWYATIFRNNGLCLNPTISFVENIGFDGTGTNTGVRDNYSSKLFHQNYSINFESNLIENKTATDRIKLFFRENNRENKNLSFARNLDRVINLFIKLKESQSKYILYGAGTGMNLVLNFLEGKIDFIIDRDIKKHNSNKNGLKIVSLPYFKEHDTQNKIIITVFGQASEITNTLTDKYQISKDRIISLDIIDD